MFPHLFQDFFALLRGLALGRALLDADHTVELQGEKGGARQKISFFEPRGHSLSVRMASSLHGRVRIVTGPYGRYVAVSTYKHDTWQVYVAFEPSVFGDRVRWWGRSVAWPELGHPPPTPTDVSEAWCKRQMQVEVVDYDTPEEEDGGREESCMLQLCLTSGLIRIELPPCTDRAAAQVSVHALAEVRFPALIQLSERCAAQENAMQMQQNTSNDALSLLQAELESERAKYREVRMTT